MKAIVTLVDPGHRQQVTGSGVEILADYPDSLLVRGEDTALTALQSKGLEVARIEEPPVRIGPVSFTLAAASQAEALAPVNVQPHRKHYFLVNAVGPVERNWLAALKALGASVIDSASANTLLVGMLPETVAPLQALPWVEDVIPYRPAMKVSPRLRGHETNAALTSSELASFQPDDAGGTEQVQITVFPNESTEEVTARIRQTGGMVLGQSEQTVTARVSTSLLPELAAMPGTQAIVPHAFPHFTNNRAASILGVAPDRSFGGISLKGEGQIVAVADSGIDTGDVATIHRDLAGRIVQIRSLPVIPSLRQYVNGTGQFDDGPADRKSAHGTHVVGSVLGSGLEAQAAGVTDAPAGIAPEARLIFQAIEQEVDWKPAVDLKPVGLYGLPENLEELFDEAYRAGARIHSNSWGGPARSSGMNIAGQYTASGQQVDGFAFTHPDMLIVFAAGNNGQQSGETDGAADSVINLDSIGAPAEAKNCVTVGATENQRGVGSAPSPGLDTTWVKFGYTRMQRAGHLSDDPEGMAMFSSRGPCEDGRIKPDVVAPGTNVLSLRSQVGPANPLWGAVRPPTHALNGKYCWSGGTSMATPLVAGAAALLREFLIKERGHFKDGEKPSSALLKALLVNGCIAPSGQFPGEIPPVPNPVCGFGRVNVSESIGNMLFDDEESHAVGSGEIRFFEVEPLSTNRPLRITLVWTDAPALVGTGGLTNRLYLQVVTPAGAILDGDTKPFPNAVNNVQQITVAAPPAGTYQIRVRGVSVVRHSPVVTSVDRPKQNFALATSNARRLAFKR